MAKQTRRVQVFIGPKASEALDVLAEELGGITIAIEVTLIDAAAEKRKVPVLRSRIIGDEGRGPWVLDASAGSRKPASADGGIISRRGKGVIDPGCSEAVRLSENGATEAGHA